MKATLDRAISAHPGAVQPRALLARYYLLTKNIDKAKEVMTDLGIKHPNNVGVQSLMGEIHLAKKEYAAAKSSLDRVVDLAPDSAKAHYLLALAHAGLNEKEKMQQELARTLEIAPSHVPALIAQTRMQLRDGRLDEAKKNLSILKKTAAENPDVLAIEAYLSAKSGNKEHALASLEQRYQASPSTKTLLGLTRFNWTLGNRQQAINDLEKWISAHPDDVSARIDLANAFTIQGQNEKAIEQYDEILEISEDNVTALNNLAWHLRKTHTERALTYAERANTLDPESAVVMDTLAELILLSKGELRRAQRLNMRALEKRPDSPTFLFRKAMILEASGKQREATTVLRQILDSQQPFPERAEAETMLARLGG
jgi:putative PEP-CTERM system TPR-repeat lipoprotein